MQGHLFSLLSLSMFASISLYLYLYLYIYTYINLKGLQYHRDGIQTLNHSRTKPESIVHQPYMKRSYTNTMIPSSEIIASLCLNQPFMFPRCMLCSIHLEYHIQPSTLHVTIGVSNVLWGGGVAPSPPMPPSFFFKLKFKLVRFSINLLLFIYTAFKPNYATIIMCVHMHPQNYCYPHVHAVSLNNTWSNRPT